MKQFLACATILTSLIFSAHAEEIDLTLSGPTKLEKTKIKSGLNVNGPFEFNVIKVEGDTKIHGPVKGTDGKFKIISINGPAEIQDVECTMISVNGPLNAKILKVDRNTKTFGNTKIEDGKLDDLAVNAETAELTNTSVHTVYFPKNSTTKPQQLILRGSSKVKGQVIFDNGNGLVITESSDIKVGDIKGGKLVQKNQ